MRLLRVEIAGPIEDAIKAALPRGERAIGEELTAVVNRLLVWEIDVARDARRGDRLDLAWTPPARGSGSPAPVVEAMRYASQKLGGTIAAYRFKAEGARWPRYYRADGAEVEQRIADAPVEDYEQITSLLRDGRRHEGVDFKTPVGSPVRATFDGVVWRRNWNFAGNGNCLDVRDAATGRHAIFLHLDVLPKDVRPGRKVRKGDVIAASGNSGRSFAPHLHYQLEAPDGRVLDPFDVHRTERATIAAADRAAFGAARAKLDAALSR
jgi:murein DD-endopeptidase MepM/ murein hydrolase activator NlpD